MTKRTQRNTTVRDRLSSEIFDVISRYIVAGMTPSDALTTLYGVVYAVGRQSGLSEMQLSNVLHLYADEYRDRATK